MALASQAGRVAQDKLNICGALGLTVRWQEAVKNRARQIVTVLVVASAVAGFLAWFKINQGDLGDSFSAFRELFRYISFHAR
jgi:hypothetical protein